MNLRAATFLSLALGASAVLRGKVAERTKLDPFDCYTENGQEYRGLQDMSASGRKCANWLDKGENPGSDGIGNHNYCRNPGGSKDKPWCYTIDPNKEEEDCVIPECKPAEEAPEPWVAPEGSKSEEAEAEGPCLYEPTEAPLAVFKEGKMCEAEKGDKKWLIGGKLTEASDAEGCRDNCRMMPGAKYFTHFGAADDDGNSCGCYREACVLVSDDLTVNDPTTYEMNLAQIDAKPHHKKHRKC